MFQASSEDALRQHLSKPRTLYVGFDITAPSFHAGHLVLLSMLGHFQRHGHKLIVLLGTGTSRIGDPSDKKSARPLLSPEVIQNHYKSLKASLEKLLNPERLKVVDNATWLNDIQHIDFLRDVGRYFSVNRMMSFDFIKNRLDAQQPLSFLEMSYLLLQSYDFYVLNTQEDCTLQLGDKTSGRILFQGRIGAQKAGKEVFALTCPLLVTASGAKMGKTAEGGAIWLNPDLLSPYDFWQFWRNTDDRDV